MSSRSIGFHQTIRPFSAVPILAAGLTLLVTVPRLTAADALPTGPATEKRFPPLQAPAGFKVTLFACDPLVEYPSVIALGPRARSVFVAHDYVTGLGIDIVRRDEVRLVEDSDGDGYADKTEVYASSFNSIQGLAYHAGTVFVMHAPFLTALRDTDGDGVADERRDLLSGLGLTPEENTTRLHCANGVTPGHDGWLYLSLGDHGCDVPRPEGDRLVLQGGGILRCRTDGRDLHVFASGLRNIYDVALDDELNVFVRDNENDGGSYKNRVYQSFFGTDHGYPYLYEERPEEALPPLASLGLGSSAGGVCYLESAFPEEYRGNLFFCEWGRALVRYPRERAHSSFAPMKEFEFTSAAANDAYGFKPTDVIVDRDGSLLISDWGDGQRPKRGRGRIYRVEWAEAKKSGASTPQNAKADSADWVSQLDSPDHHRRIEAQIALEARGREAVIALRQSMDAGKLGAHGRMHGVWILASVAGRDSIPKLLDFARNDADARVQVQAVRALADLGDPVMQQHRLDAGRGDMTLAASLADFGKTASKPVLLEIIVALARLHWSETADWLRQNLREPDAALSHAAMQALRQSQNWPAVLALLDESDSAPIRSLALRAIAGRADAAIVDGLQQRLQSDPDPVHRMAYADALTRICRKPGPWVYWNYRPAPRPANTVSWERTTDIEASLDRALSDADRGVRLATLRRMQREQIPARLETLSRWLQTERDPGSVAVIIEFLRDRPAESVRDLFEAAIRNREHTEANRGVILNLYSRALDAASEGRLLDLAKALEDGPVLAESLRRLGSCPALPSHALLREKLGSPAAEVRAAALEAVAALQDREATEVVLKLLGDAEARVRQAAALAAGRLAAKEAIEPLLRLAREPDPQVRRESLDALRCLHESRVVPLAVAALQDRPCQQAALECIAELGGPAQLDAVSAIAATASTPDTTQAVARTLFTWQKNEPAASPLQPRLDDAMARLHGTSGSLLGWKVSPPVSTSDESGMIKNILREGEPSPPPPDWRPQMAAGKEGRLELESHGQDNPAAAWFAISEIAVSESVDAQFLTSSAGPLRVWLNGRQVYQSDRADGFVPDSERFAARLIQGINRVLVRVPARDGTRFHLRFRRKSSDAGHEALTQFALTKTGDVQMGRETFMNAEKSQCLKCHRLGDQGGRVGPDLTGVGSRFSRIYLVESILDPNRTIAPGFETMIVQLKDGRMFSGVRVSETESTLMLGNLVDPLTQQAIAKTEIEKTLPMPVSVMPMGLEKSLTRQEFVDLIAFLMGQR